MDVLSLSALCVMYSYWSKPAVASWRQQISCTS